MFSLLAAFGEGSLVFDLTIEDFLSTLTSDFLVELAILGDFLLEGVGTATDLRGVFTTVGGDTFIGVDFLCPNLETFDFLTEKIRKNLKA